MKYDCVIIGAGVIGASIARELSKYQLRVIVLEKENDVCLSQGGLPAVFAGADRTLAALLPCGGLGVALRRLPCHAVGRLGLPDFVYNGHLRICVRTVDGSRTRLPPLEMAACRIPAYVGEYRWCVFALLVVSRI